mmetsp:Transcript_16353/g.49042  ORF Transcript_16353/g.49042 Transcript_16353/m.49042 type:complete len:259 (-) Transcript_16353:752-1528(-)
MRAAGDLRGPPAVGDTRGLGTAAPAGCCSPRDPSAARDPRAAFPPLMPTCTPVAATTQSFRAERCASADKASSLWDPGWLGMRCGGGEEVSAPSPPPGTSNTSACTAPGWAGRPSQNDVGCHRVDLLPVNDIWCRRGDPRMLATSWMYSSRCPRAVPSSWASCPASHPATPSDPFGTGRPTIVTSGWARPGAGCPAAAAAAPPGTTCVCLSGSSSCSSSSQLRCSLTSRSLTSFSCSDLVRSSSGHLVFTSAARCASS